MKRTDTAEHNPVHEAVRAAALPPRARRRRSMRFIAAVAAMSAAFAVLAAFARATAFFPVDLSVTRFLQSLDCPFMSALMNAVSWPGYAPQSLAIVAAAALLLWFLGLRWEALALLPATAIEELSNLAVKLLVHRPRPPADLVRVVRSLGSYSFPSGHVMLYTVLFGYLFYLIFALMKPSRLRTLLLCLAALPIPLVGAARIYLGEHWFSDTAGAYLLGGLALIAAVQLYRWGKDRFFLNQPAVRGGK